MSMSSVQYDEYRICLKMKGMEIQWFAVEACRFANS